MRSPAIALLALLPAAGACAMRQPIAASPTRTTVVLLADDDGTVGRASVSNPIGSIDLSAARQASDVSATRAPDPPRELDDAAVMHEFGEALAALPLPPLHLLLRFQFDSDELTAESKAALPALVSQVRERPAPEVIVIGHTDTVGSPEDNQRLGLRRAEAARRILIDAGIDAGSIETISHGEADLLVPTPDNTSAAANRRVEITLR